jgi:purine-binding chemotaxis protein CheW
MMDDNPQLTDYVTFTTADQIFGLPIARVQEVFRPARITRVPLAGAQIAGVLNLRGRIVTAIDMRSRLGLQAREEGLAPMAIGIESRGESFGLLVDALGEVLRLSGSDSMVSCWSCSTSTAYLTSAPKRRRRDGAVLKVRKASEIKAGLPAQ